MQTIGRRKRRGVGGKKLTFWVTLAFDPLPFWPPRAYRFQRKKKTLAYCSLHNCSLPDLQLSSNGKLQEGGRRSSKAVRFGGLT